MAGAEAVQAIPDDLKIHMCDRCPERFLFETMLECHKRGYCGGRVGPGEGQCHICGKLFITGNLARHVKTHESSKNTSYQHKETMKDLSLKKCLEEFGLPPGRIHPRNGYPMGYNEKYNFPNWTYERVEPLPENQDRIRRRSSTIWCKDSMLPPNCNVEVKGLTGPDGFQVGHNANWANHRHEPAEERDSRYISNASFQHQNLNQGWNIPLEKCAQPVAKNYGCLHVWNLNFMEKEVEDKEGRKVEPKVVWCGGNVKKAVAHYYGKLLLVVDVKTNQYYYDAFFSKNDSTASADPSNHRCTLEELNDACGMNLIYAISPTQKDVVSCATSVKSGTLWLRERRRANCVIEVTGDTPQPPKKPKTDCAGCLDLKEKVAKLEEENADLKEREATMMEEIASLRAELEQIEM